MTKNKEMKKIQEKLEYLHNLMSKTLPVNALSQHPFSHYQDRFGLILDVIDGLINKSQDEIEILKKENNDLKERILNHKKCLEIEFDDNLQDTIQLKNIEKDDYDENFENFLLEKEFLQTKEKKLFSEIEKIERQIKAIKKENDELSSWIGKEFLNENTKIDEINNLIDEKMSIKNLELLKSINDELNKIKSEKEAKRIYYYKVIVDLAEEMMFETPDEVLKQIKEDFELVNISNLYTKYRYVKSEKAHRKKLVKEYILQILDLKDRVKDYFSFEKEITEKITDFNIKKLTEYLNILKEEEEKHFDKIFTTTYDELTSVCEVFEMSMVEFEKTRENLDIMKKIIVDLNSKKQAFINCISLIEKRNELKEKMLEFEKIASDPRRLFKSSFQLLHEEKFRKNAVPNLLKLENELLKTLEEYEENYGVLMYKNEDYRKILEADVKNRIINKSVFIIHKGDSPRKKIN